jgi:hypothetical protein
MTRRGLLLATATAALAPAVVQAQPPFRGVAPGDVLRGRFVQERRIKGFAHPLVSSGDFILVPGQGLIWRTKQPFAIVTVITAAGLVQDVNGTETTHLSATRLPFLGRLYDLLGGALSGDWHALEAMFKATQRGDAQDWDLELEPRGPVDPVAMPFRSITLRGGTYVNEVVISRLNDDSDRLVFSGQTITRGGLTQAEASRLQGAGQ